MLFLLVPMACLSARAFEIRRGQTIRLTCDTTLMQPVVRTAIRMLADDCQRVLDSKLTLTPEGDIAVRIDPNVLKHRREAFRLTVKGEQLSIVASDSHGVAYGLLELSRLMGVSPWEWWADVTPRQLEHFTLPDGYRNEQSPDVEYRGIFINDEDWGLLPWASQTYEPENQHSLNHTRINNKVANWEVMPEGKQAKVKGRVGPRTHSRIFELLLRLRANTFWPAMHECTEPFFLCDENRQVAHQYGIYIGTSHCEPMACNVNGEWRVRGEGEYDYVSNARNVQDFWEKRVRDVAGQPILYTLGMRGVHDGAMNGAKTVEEQKAVLERVLRDQRNMLSKYVDKDVTQVPQVFIPYKEVLDVYNAGLEVPEDVCLMWCDDNYGYIRHFPTKEERKRKGGNGIYYHVSYWGRPHDYLWLGTFSPSLLYQQMSAAYDRGIRRMWVLNVGDIKPAEYQTELFMDMAWNIETVRRQGTEEHLRRFLCREFGKTVGEALAALMTEHYRLAFECKPEFLGGTRAEEPDRQYWNTIRDLPWTWKQVNQRLAKYQLLEDATETLGANVPRDRREAYFQLVKYPVQGAAEMNKKMLTAQQARHGRATWEESEAALDSIRSLTRIYNKGKWNGIMDCQPRRMPVFLPVPHTTSDTDLPEDDEPWLVLKQREATFGQTSADTLLIEVHLLPTHAQEGDSLRFQLRVDGWKSPVTNYETYGRSEEWKQNVLRNQAVRQFRVPVNQKKKRHHISLQSLDPGIYLQEIVVREKK